MLGRMTDGNDRAQHSTRTTQHIHSIWQTISLQINQFLTLFLFRSDMYGSIIKYVICI